MKDLVDILIRLVQFIADLNISRILSFLMSLMNGINWILTLAVLLHVTYFVIHAIAVGDSVWLTRFQLGFTHLCQHTFRHGFRDILNPLCLCSTVAETATHYFLVYHSCISKAVTLTVISSIKFIKDSQIIDEHLL